MSDRIQELRAFVRAAETGSFSRTARELRLSQPSVSRLVMALEARLGVPLLLRTTRRVSPTEAGQAYLERVRTVLAELDDADASAGGAQMRGTLRVALPVTLGSREIVPRLSDFLDRHPALRVELLMDEKPQDLVLEGVDLALRIGRPADSSFGLRQLARTDRLAIVAPGYLARHGTPMHPAELATHHCILGPGQSGDQAWVFGSPAGSSVSVRVAGRLLLGAAQGVTAAVAAGYGIALASSWMCARELASGEVVRILGDYRLSPVELFALLPAGRRTSTRARAFADHLAVSFQDRSTL